METIRNAPKEVAESRLNYELIHYFLKTYRKMTDDVARERLTQELIKRGTFYVPFDKYLSKSFPSYVMSYFAEYYRAGRCTLAGSMVFPLSTIQGEILGFMRNNPKSPDKYNYPEKYTFNKSRYFQVSKENLRKAINLGYVFIVEGVYDEMAVSSLGFPCIGLAGSELGKARKTLLDVIPVKILISDRDLAGFKLYQECDKFFKGKLVNVSLPSKDVDAYLRIEDNATKLKQLFQEHIRDGFPMSVIEVPA